ncbi:MAG: DNRLRE domain-containing protein [Planctomycetaceae bacterium]|nr:DNRLRE domain-containing protein [Planctomycetaceae bacterium]
MKHLAISVLVAAVLAGASAAPAAEVLFQDGLNSYAGTEDTSLVQNAANNNYGGRTTLIMGPPGSGQQRAPIIQFDLSSIAGQYESIESMKLRFWVSNTSSSATFNLNLLREGNAGWVEGSSNGTTETGTSTWNYRVYNTQQWLGGTSGARLAADVYGAVATFTLSTATTPVGTMVEINVDPAALAANVDTLTEIVDLWTRGGGSDNAGFQIYGGYNASWQVHSSESATPAMRPQLVIEYSPIPEPASALLLVLGALAASARRRRWK